MKKREFLTRPIERGYRQDLVEKISAEVQFSSRNTALKNEPKTPKKILPFVTTFNPSNLNLTKIPMKHWYLISGNNNLA